MPHPLTCPHCRGSLKSNKTPPLLGVDVLCPKCKKFFKVTNSVVAVAAGVAANNGIKAGRPRVADPRRRLAAALARDGNFAALGPAPSCVPASCWASAIVVLALVMLGVWLAARPGPGHEKGQAPESRTRKLSRTSRPSRLFTLRSRLVSSNRRSAGETGYPQDRRHERGGEQDRPLHADQGRRLSSQDAETRRHLAWPAWRRGHLWLVCQRPGRVLRHDPARMRVPADDPQIIKAAESCSGKDGRRRCSKRMACRCTSVFWTGQPSPGQAAD